jgi:TRAP transporter TAXI family solute receptor
LACRTSIQQEKVLGSGRRLHFVKKEGIKMKPISRSWKMTLAISLFLFLYALIPNTAFAKQYLSFGIAKPGGTFYQLGAGFSNIINKYVPEVTVTGESTGGSIENINLLATGKIDLAFCGSSYYMSAKERGLNMSNVRLISTGYVSAVQWVTKKKSSIKTIRDFVGKRIAVGLVGSGTLETTKISLETGYGISFDQIKPLYVGLSESAKAIQDGTADVTNLFAAVPTAAVLEIMTTFPIRIIPFDKEAVKKISGKYPGYPEVIIPKGSYKGINENILTIGTPCLFLVSSRLNEKLVYDMVKAIYGHPKERDAIMPAAKEFNLENAFRGTKDLGIPFDPGAVKYYKEKGVWKE